MLRLILLERSSLPDSLFRLHHGFQEHIQHPDPDHRLVQRNRGCIRLHVPDVRLEAGCDRRRQRKRVLYVWYGCHHRQVPSKQHHHLRLDPTDQRSDRYRAEHGAPESYRTRTKYAVMKY